MICALLYYTPVKELWVTMTSVYKCLIRGITNSFPVKFMELNATDEGAREWVIQSREMKLDDNDVQEENIVMIQVEKPILVQ